MAKRRDRKVARAEAMPRLFAQAFGETHKKDSLIDVLVELAGEDRAILHAASPLASNWKPRLKSLRRQRAKRIVDATDFDERDANRNFAVTTTKLL